MAWALYFCLVSWSCFVLLLVHVSTFFTCVTFIAVMRSVIISVFGLGLSFDCFSVFFNFIVSNWKLFVIGDFLSCLRTNFLFVYKLPAFCLMLNLEVATINNHNPFVSIYIRYFLRLNNFKEDVLNSDRSTSSKISW